MKRVSYFAQRSGLLFSPKEEATSLNNVMDKNSICAHKNVHNLVTVNYWPLVDTVGYSIQTCWLLQFLLKPLVTSYIHSSDQTFIYHAATQPSMLGCVAA